MVVWYGNLSFQTFPTNSLNNICAWFLFFSFLIREIYYIILTLKRIFYYFYNNKNVDPFWFSYFNYKIPLGFFLKFFSPLYIYFFSCFYSIFIVSVIGKRMQSRKCERVCPGWLGILWRRLDRSLFLNYFIYFKIFHF